MCGIYKYQYDTIGILTLVFINTSMTEHFDTGIYKYQYDTIGILTLVFINTSVTHTHEHFDTSMTL